METFDWQTPTALVIVAFTFAAFVWRHLKKRRRSSGGGCASGCCDTKPSKFQPKRPPLN